MAHRPNHDLKLETLLAALDAAAASDDREILASLDRGAALLRQAVESRGLAISARLRGEVDSAMALEASSHADARNGWQHLLIGTGTDW